MIIIVIAKNPIIVLTGASGSGKTTIANYLVNNYGFTKPKTCTTRVPRMEEDENSYNFMTKQDFEAEINKGAMVEYVQIFGHYYGSQVTAFAPSGKLVVALNNSGSETIKNLYPDRVIRVFMFISKDIMLQRIKSRSDINQVELIHRLDEFEILNNIYKEGLENQFDYVINANECLRYVCVKFDEIVGILRTYDTHSHLTRRIV